MSIFKLSNQIFDLGLTANELSVYAYLCSLPSLQNTLDNNAIVTVKQSTIAEKCCIKAVQTVSKILSSLTDKSLVEPVRRTVKRNGYKSTYVYEIKKHDISEKYFFADRYAFSRLKPVQMAVYLFMCKSYSNTLKDSWNSYNDIAVQTGLARATVIKTVSELTAMKYIVKYKRKAKLNKRVFVDNHYQIIMYVRNKIRKKCKKNRMYCEYIRANNGKTLLASSKKHIYNNTFFEICQVISKFFLGDRGSISD